MALSDVYRAIEELRSSAGSSDDRLHAVLGPRGWMEALNEIRDDDFRSLCRKGIESLMGVGSSTQPSTKARLAQRTKARSQTEAPPDMFGDIVGRSPERLVEKLNHDNYYVASLGRDVARHELLTELSALSELRAATRELRLEAEDLQKRYAWDEAIFAELQRQLCGSMAA